MKKGEYFILSIGSYGYNSDFHVIQRLFKALKDLNKEELVDLYYELNPPDGCSRCVYCFDTKEFIQILINRFYIEEVELSTWHIMD
ncbi:unnamed protein product [marine sediment metagenome]|uniref:Uncharacterized protein n=1 Tax=marine sediment metagenome TaxID=412755 RepID=X0W5T0_9ZZZZ